MRIPSRAYLIRPARTRRGTAKHISKPVRPGPSKASITSRTSPKDGSPASWRPTMASSTIPIRLRPGAIWVSTTASLLSPVACTISNGCDTTVDQGRHLLGRDRTPPDGRRASRPMQAGGSRLRPSDPAAGCGRVVRAARGPLWGGCGSGRRRAGRGNPCRRRSLGRTALPTSRAASPGSTNPWDARWPMP